MSLTVSTALDASQRAGACTRSRPGMALSSRTPMTRVTRPSTRESRWIKVVPLEKAEPMRARSNARAVPQGLATDEMRRSDRSKQSMTVQRPATIGG